MWRERRLGKAEQLGAKLTGVIKLPDLRDLFQNCEKDKWSSSPIIRNESSVVVASVFERWHPSNTTSAVAHHETLKPVSVNHMKGLIVGSLFQAEAFGVTSQIEYNQY